MIYTFENIDRFLYSIEKEIIDVLFEYKLLSKLDRSAKKIIFYYFVKNFGEEISKNKDLLFFHDCSFSESHELFTYYENEKQFFYEKTLLRQQLKHPYKNLSQC